MISYEALFENNRQWMAQKTADDPAYFAELAKAQTPDYLYIGCSDSRVTAEELMGAGPGEVFVHRNIANLVNNVDLNAMSVIEYAVKQLRVKHIVVCGHYNCGGVRAAMVPEDLGILNPWLRNVRDVHRQHAPELNAIADPQARYNRLVELNVRQQCVNVIKTAVVQLAYLADGYPVVHGWVFDLHTGALVDLHIDFKGILKDVMAVYDLASHSSGTPPTA